MNLPHVRLRHSASRLGWYLVLPKLGVLLLILSVLSLLWILHRNEVEEQHSTLVGDVLWLEQNLHFQLLNHEEQLQQLAHDLVDQDRRLTQANPNPAALFQVRASHLVKNNAGLEQVLWLDTAQQLQHTVPNRQGHDYVAQLLVHANLASSLNFAHKIGRPVYSRPLVLTPSSTSRFLLIVPLSNQQGLIGSLIGVYSLENLLHDNVPWWFAEKYQVKLLDEDGNLLASKSKIDGTPDLEYQLPLDPPGYGMKILVSAYKKPGNTIQRLISAAIILLGLGVFWSLWSLRVQVKRRVATEEALRSEHAFRQAMEDSLTVGMRARDLQGKIIYVNPAFCDITGFRQEELIGLSPPMPYWAPEELSETLMLHQAVMTGNAPRNGFEARLMRKNGERFDALIYEAPLIDGKGQQTGWMGSVLDISERKKTEELARQQQEKLQLTSRLVTMGEMASTLAHELNQPLSAIASYTTGCLNLLATGQAEPADLQHALNKMATQAQRAGKIIQRVHEFVRKSEPKLAHCSLLEIIEDCINFMEMAAKKLGIRIEKDFPAHSPELLADRLMLEQVLLNLMRNGMEAMQDTPAEDKVLLLRVVPLPDMVEVHVQDHGIGVSPALEDKLFSAFFTTKAEGMGIGLSICRSIIEFHRGRLELRRPPPSSATVQGANFVFTLPLEKL